MNKKKYWLMKSEPGVFGIDDLETMPDKTEHWDGVRNYQARNFMRDDMRLGDLVFFYHSNSKPSGISGLATVVKEGYPDHTSQDPQGEHFDPKSTPENPRWFMVDIKHVKTFKELISLDKLKKLDELKDMILLNRSRLSVQPVEIKHAKIILNMAQIPFEKYID